MTTHRCWQRNCARLGAVVLAISALLSLLTMVSAAATVTSDEPSVQIGESRSIERPESTVAPATEADGSVGGVAVAGIAIARDAVPDTGTNPLPFFIGGLCAVAAIVAALYLRLRRLRTITA